MGKLEIMKLALDATDVAISVCDPNREDYPIIYVNPEFTRMTGYQLGEIIGKNCRFLQGPDTDPNCVAKLRTSINECLPVSMTLKNYKKDGTPFWNKLSIKPVFNRDKEIEYFVGTQQDVSAERQEIQSLLEVNQIISKQSKLRDSG